MQFRHDIILAEKSITTAGVETINLRGADPISALFITVDLTNNGYAPSGHPCDAIKTIKLVDGSEPFFELEGCDAQAVAQYAIRGYLENMLNYYDNGVSRIVIPIYFGRWLYDYDMAFVPRKYQNPQLKIEHDYSLGGCSPDVATLEVHGIFMDQISPEMSGFMVYKDIYNWTSSAGHTEYIDIPTDTIIRKMFFSALHDDEEPDVHFRNIKLVEERGKRTVIDIDGRDFLRIMMQNYAPVRDYCDGYVQTASRAFYFTPHKNLMINVETAEAEQATGRAWSGGRKQTIYAVDDKDILMEAWGYCPHGVMCYDFGNDQHSPTWYNVKHLDSLRLEVLHRATLANTTTCRILLQQFKEF